MKKGDWLKPIKANTSVVRLILLRMEEALRNKELKPGDRLPSEPELVKSLGVGKSSVREAMKMLDAMGIVDIRQGNGTYVRKEPSVDAVNPLIFSLYLHEGTNQDLVDLRAMFEPAYTIMAMHRATAGDMREIEAAICIMEEKIVKGTQSAEDDLLFHRAILKSTHNHYVIRIGEAILRFFKASIEKPVHDNPDISIRDHKKIFQAFREKDEQKLRDAVAASFEGWEKTFNDGAENK
ncbi:MAG: FadR/GntR family transcriptional regulator [Bacillota bacterium]